MKQINFILNRIINVDYIQMYKTAKTIHKKINRPTFVIFLDMIYSGLKYQAGYIDYYEMGLYNLNKKQRETFITRGVSNKLVAKYNLKEFRELFDDKAKFNKKYNEYLKREWLFIDNNYDEFCDFIKNKKEIIAKITNESGGRGVQKIEIDNYKNQKDLYNHLINTNYLLLEEVVKQHKKLAQLHPVSVNTVRIISFLYNKKVNILAAFLKAGNGKVVDNSSSGGMLAPIDVKTGMITYPALDGDLNVFKNHPMTKIQFEGFEVPFWKELLKMVDEVAKITPELQYIGWDIAIDDDGPLIIEGNHYPSHTYYQLPLHTPNKTGLLKKFQDIINNN